MGKNAVVLVPPVTMAPLKKVAGKSLKPKPPKKIKAATSPATTNDIGKKVEKVDENHFVYMIQEREFMKTGEPIYKIGKTTQEPSRRMEGYPKGSRVIIYIETSLSGCHYMERQLIAEFDRLYKLRDDIGREYYEGDLDRMKATFLRIIRDVEHLTESPGTLSFPRKIMIWAWRWIWR